MEPENQGMYYSDIDDGFNEVQNSSPNFNEMTEAEREAEFRRQHQEYIAVKIARKKELTKVIK